jgi:hypothetical protein
MTTSHQTELLELLRRSEPTPAAKRLLKRTAQQFILDYGWWYEPVELPQQIALGTPQQCHKNATDLALADDSLIYCEGIALFNTGSLPTLHAWVTDGQGQAIDNTWSRSGVAYAGVPFKSFFVNMKVLKEHATVGLLDDWEKNYPLRRDLGDRPDEWLEPQGFGTARVNGEEREP